MDFQIYDCSDNSQILLLNDSRSNNKNWNLSMENDEYFGWTGDLKIDESKFDGGTDESSTGRSPRKRKIGEVADDDDLAKSNGGEFKQKCTESGKEKIKNGQGQNDGTSRMPQWQVDDIADLNADIEGSLNGLGTDHSNNSFNMSEAILSLSGMTVFKQEAPSPTNNNADGNVVFQRQSIESPTTTTPQLAVSQSNMVTDTQNNTILNTTLHQLLSQSGYNGIQNGIDGNVLNSPSALSQDGYGVTSSNNAFTEDCRFQYVLAAATSIATKVNEDTLTYLNQGQSYEIKLKKLGDLSMYRGKLLKSVIRICFHERRLQYMEKEQMNSWQRSRPGDRILEIDVPLSYGLCDVVQPTSALNTVQFSWDPTKEVGAYIKVNCISTEFTPKKHGGEKGVPFRIQVETFQKGDGFDTPKRLHAAACQIKVFKLKGADRKHKQDREKILKRPVTEQEKYQPSYECTVLNDISNESLLGSPTLAVPFSPESGSQHSFTNQPASDDKTLVALPSPPHQSLPTVEKVQPQEQNVVTTDQLSALSSTQQASNWLTCNRFDKYLQTFSSFSGADMLRMSRDDLIQICGHADGIRLYNALHSKSIAPKLTIYVCRENSTVFNAIFLTALNNGELLQKLSALLKTPCDQVRDIYLLGPQSIHVQLSNDVMRHIKDDTMFHVEVLQENGNYVFLLKPSSRC